MLGFDSNLRVSKRTKKNNCKSCKPVQRAVKNGIVNRKKKRNSKLTVLTEKVLTVFLLNKFNFIVNYSKLIIIFAIIKH